jgi:hypothetical protein
MFSKQNATGECLLCDAQTDGLCRVFTVLFPINGSAMTCVDIVMFKKRIGKDMCLPCLVQ